MNQAQPYPSTKCMPKMVIGIGSYHGDDRVGWEVIDQLSAMNVAATQFYKASVPHDLLDWFDANAQTHIVDGSQDEGFQVRRIELQRMENGQVQIATRDESNLMAPKMKLPNLRSGSTHHFGLMASIQLAAELDRLPQTMVLWTVPVLNTAKNATVSVQASQWAEECVARLAQELAYA